MYSSAWNVSLEKNLWFHNVESLDSTFQKESYMLLYYSSWHWQQVQVCIMKYGPLNMVLFPPKWGMIIAPFNSQGTIIPPYQIYSVNRFMITNTWWAEHCTYPSIMLAGVTESDGYHSDHVAASDLLPCSPGLWWLFGYTFSSYFRFESYTMINVHYLKDILNEM
jgi:hypothetical protein